MNEIAFTKMEGAGNDYIYINCFDHELSKPQDLAVTMSHRRFGVGADGLVLICPSQVAPVKMRMFNADGSESAMCGNAIRCVAKYALDHGLVPGKPNELQIETLAGIKDIQVSFDAVGLVSQARVNMGVPELKGVAIPSLVKLDQVVDQNFLFDHTGLKGTLVNMGNPHLVTFVDHVDQAPVAKLGPLIEHDPLFPQRINVEFVEVMSPNRVRQRTWERGSGETWACGTGACAVCVAGVLTNRTQSTILVELTGGQLEITWKGPGEPVYMTGPAKEVFQGIWRLQPSP